MELTKKNKRQMIVCVTAAVLTAIITLFGSFADRTATFDLSSETDVKIDSHSAYSPHLSLPKGKYEFSSQNGFYAYSSDGRLLGSSNGKSAQITLDKDESDIVICSASGSLNKITVSANRALSRDMLFVSLFVLLGLLFIIYVKYRKKDRSGIIAMIIVFSVLLSSYSAMSGSVLFGHDLNFHLYRIEGIKDGILSGQFPVRVHPTHNNGYGYITASLYPELFMYFPALLRLLGMSPSMAYNCFLVFVNAMTAYVMYVSAKGITRSDFAATTASVIYTLSTWRVINLYYRAAIGEALAMVFFPLVIYGVYTIIKGDAKKWWVLALACTGVFQSHIISTVFVALILLLAVIVFIKDIIKEKRYLGFIKAGILTILLNAWYLAAFLKYYFGLDLAIKHVAENKEFYQNAIFPTQLFNVFNTSFGYSKLLDGGVKGEIALSLGVGVSICLIICFAYFVFRKKRALKHDDFHFVFFAAACALMLMATTLFPWKLLQQNTIINKFCGTVRMPWRFLSLASPIFTITAAAISAAYIKDNDKKRSFAIILSLVCGLSFVIWGAAYTNENSASLRRHQAAPAAYSAGYDDEYFVAKTDIKGLTPNKYTASAGISVAEHTKNGTNLSFKINGSASDGSWVEVPLLYYPGYSATDQNGKKLATDFGTGNVMRVALKSGTNSVKIRYDGFILFKIADILTILTIAAWILIAYGKRKDKKWKVLKLV